MPQLKLHGSIIQKSKRKLIEANEPSQEAHKLQEKEQRWRKKTKQSLHHEQEDAPNLDDMLLATAVVKKTVPEIRGGLVELATAATSMHSFFLAPMVPVANQVSLSLAQPQDHAFEIQNTMLKKYVADSKKCNNWVSGWEEENGRSHTLEMLGYALLEAALLLQLQSATYRNQKDNPAIQFAVKFLLMSITHTDDPTEEQRELSFVYYKLLKPFTVFKIMELEPQYYLEHLRTHFTNHNMPSFHNLSSQEMVETLFKTLASMCSVEDYELITAACFKSLKTTTDGYTKENCLTV